MNAIFMEQIKEIKLFTKKIPLTFDENGNSINTLDIDKIKEEIGDKDIDLRSLTINQAETFIMVTFRIFDKSENGKSIGFGG
ncbi:hypothetical protein BKI52_00575 [marine bacterium AO1-C]|nr:hypothetical protein BKI52_00575 [marine bacterium AO1-C]